MRPLVLAAALCATAACTNNDQGSCIPTVASTQLHEISCGSEAPQGICFSEFDNGF